MSEPSDPQVDQQRREEERAEEDILRYLIEHPRAMDTVEGIAEWWIMRQKVRVDVETVTRALQRLTAKGLLEEMGSAEFKRYRLKK